jgi:hypothetical protein
LPNRNLIFIHVMWKKIINAMLDENVAGLVRDRRARTGQRPRTVRMPPSTGSLFRTSRAAMRERLNQSSL